MKYDTHWNINNYPSKDSKESILLGVSEITNLAKELKKDDVIYIHHPTKKDLSRIAIWGVDTKTVCVNVQGSVGSYSTDIPTLALNEMLNNFIDLVITPQKYGLKSEY